MLSVVRTQELLAFIEGLNAEEMGEVLHILGNRIAAREHKPDGRVPLSPEEHDLLRQGNVIDAIRAIRARLSLGLREAKDIIDTWRGSPWR